MVGTLIRVPITPDNKDWTWVLAEPCPDCGFDAQALDTATAPTLIRDDARAWEERLAQDDARRRPDEHTWSPLEYACHVRDVHEVFAGRLALMLDHDDPSFPNWDQDETAVEKQYDAQDPLVVTAELSRAAETVAAAYEEVRPDQWERRGFRSNGSVFTVDTLLRYHLHDVVHHAHDVGLSTARHTGGR